MCVDYKALLEIVRKDLLEQLDAQNKIMKKVPHLVTLMYLCCEQTGDVPELPEGYPVLESIRDWYNNNGKMKRSYRRRRPIKQDAPS